MHKFLIKFTRIVAVNYVAPEAQSLLFEADKSRRESLECHMRLLVALRCFIRLLTTRFTHCSFIELIVLRRKSIWVVIQDQVVEYFNRSVHTQYARRNIITDHLLIWLQVSCFQKQLLKLE